MRKVIFIIPILFAYAIILGHNLIPHSHHTHPSESIHNHNHHHSSHHKQHQHDDSNKEGEEEHGSLPDLFAHFVHSPITVNFGHTLVFIEDVNELSPIQSTFFIVEKFFTFDIVLAERKLPPDDCFQFYSNFSARHSSLRAPPVF